MEGGLCFLGAGLLPGGGHFRMGGKELERWSGARLRWWMEELYRSKKKKNEVLKLSGTRRGVQHETNFRN